MKGETKEKIFVYFLVGNTIISLIAPFTSCVWLAAGPFIIISATLLIIDRGGIWNYLDWIKEETYSKLLGQKIMRIKRRLEMIGVGCTFVSLLSFLFCISVLEMGF